MLTHTTMYTLDVKNARQLSGGGRPNAEQGTINPYTIDFVYNKPKGIRSGVPDPTRLKVDAIPFMQPGNSIRNVGMRMPDDRDTTDGWEQGIGWLKTPAMLRRQDVVYDLLLNRNRQDWRWSDRGTWSSPKTSIDLGSFRPNSRFKWC